MTDWLTLLLIAVVLLAGAVVCSVLPAIRRARQAAERDLFADPRNWFV
jgi:hypothetical protein